MHVKGDERESRWRHAALLFPSAQVGSPGATRVIFRLSVCKSQQEDE
jgi:hypothetical protein